MLDEVDQMLAVLDGGFPPVHEMTGAEARAAVAARRQPVANIDDVRAAEDLVLDGVPVRRYLPHGTQEQPRPVVVFAHGGGFVFCDIETHDGFCRMLAKHTGAVVVSVDYRLAPEHRAPAAADDMSTVVEHVVAHAEAWGVDPAAVLVAGDSAGGNLAAVAALRARAAGIDLAGQVLLYPVIEPDFETESYRRFGTGHFNTRAAMEWYWEQYLGGAALPEPAWQVAPLRADDHGDLAPAVVVTAGRDPLSSEGERYAATLRSAGVPVRHRHYPDLFHGFATIGPFAPAASARSLLWRDIAALLATAPTPRSTS
ncbi:alpha/beta hydrolase [Nocardioides daejeonensis]|uniref:alpha/beta hydrolase n=1 Tax=Nocardioides daejeonensis TaxID=1046556 RepID=UPI000D74C7FB|nr:alpha/beta hydrolase [Nocardioides daejeonensis]